MAPEGSRIASAALSLGRAPQPAQGTSASPPSSPGSWSRLAAAEPRPSWASRPWPDQGKNDRAFPAPSGRAGGAPRRPGPLASPPPDPPVWSSHRSGNPSAPTASPLPATRRRRSGLWRPPGSSTPAQLTPGPSGIPAERPRPCPPASPRTRPTPWPRFFAAAFFDVPGRPPRHSTASPVGSRASAPAAGPAHAKGPRRRSAALQAQGMEGRAQARRPFIRRPRGGGRAAGPGGRRWDPTPAAPGRSP